MKKIIFTTGWLICGLISAGFYNADVRGDFYDLSQSPIWAANTKMKMIGYGVIFGPVGLILSPFLTGGYQHGWTYRGDAIACTSKFPDIWCK